MATPADITDTTEQRENIITCTRCSNLYDFAWRAEQNCAPTNKATSKNILLIFISLCVLLSAGFGGRRPCTCVACAFRCPQIPAFVNCRKRRRQLLFLLLQIIIKHQSLWVATHHFGGEVLSCSKINAELSTHCIKYDASVDTHTNPAFIQIRRKKIPHTASRKKNGKICTKCHTHTSLTRARFQILSFRLSVITLHLFARFVYVYKYLLFDNERTIPQSWYEYDGSGGSAEHGDDDGVSAPSIKWGSIRGAMRYLTWVAANGCETEIRTA